MSIKSMFSSNISIKTICLLYYRLNELNKLSLVSLGYSSIFFICLNNFILFLSSSVSVKANFSNYPYNLVHLYPLTFPKHIQLIVEFLYFKHNSRFQCS